MAQQSARRVREEPGVLIVPGARIYDLVSGLRTPIRAPRAASLHRRRPDRWQHPTTCRSSSKTACISRGVHRSSTRPNAPSCIGRIRFRQILAIAKSVELSPFWSLRSNRRYRLGWTHRGATNDHKNALFIQAPRQSASPVVWLSHRRGHKSRCGQKERNRWRRQQSARTRSRRLGDCRNARPADPVHQERRHRRPRPLPHARSAEGQVQGLGYAATASSIPRRSMPIPASSSISPRCRRRTTRRRAQYYPAIYWYSMLKIPAADQFGGKSDIPDRVTRTEWVDAIKNNQCIGCHQIGRLATRTIPKGLGEFKTSEDAWASAHPVRTGWSADGQSHRRRLLINADQILSPNGPTASPKANCRQQSRRGRKASTAISCRPCSGHR